MATPSPVGQPSAKFDTILATPTFSEKEKLDTLEHWTLNGSLPIIKTVNSPPSTLIFDNKIVPSKSFFFFFTAENREFNDLMLVMKEKTTKYTVFSLYLAKNQNGIFITSQDFKEDFQDRMMMFIKPFEKQDIRNRINSGLFLPAELINFLNELSYIACPQENLKQFASPESPQTGGLEKLKQFSQLKIANPFFKGINRQSLPRTFNKDSTSIENPVLKNIRKYSFFFDLGRNEAEEKLKNEDYGVFLIRPSSQPPNLVISYKLSPELVKKKYKKELAKDETYFEHIDFRVTDQQTIQELSSKNIYFYLLCDPDLFKNNQVSMETMEVGLLDTLFSYGDITKPFSNAKSK